MEVKRKFLKSKLITEGYRKLALAVIRQAALDVKKAVKEREKETALYFLNNSNEVSFYKDLAGIECDISEINWNFYSVGKSKGRK